MKKTILLITIGLITAFGASANDNLDSDQDGVPDKDEINIYRTDIYSQDSDQDGYSDWTELNNGYSPHNPEPVKLEDNDYDKDGLSDRHELNFGTNLSDSDTDDDGESDGEEIYKAQDPHSAENKKLDRRIDVSIYTQKLYYFVDGVKLIETPVSSGLYNTTPRGEFTIQNKHPKAWSSYGLWMPYWMAITPDGRYGLHELPVWPSGYREGEDHLGRPASHGCVRVGYDMAPVIYDLTDVGVKVNIY